MNKQEVKARIAELISTGVAKSEIFKQLSGQGLKDSKIAYLIAAHADPALCAEHRGKVKLLIGLMVFQSLLCFVGGFFLGAAIGPNAKWIFALICLVIPLLFAWGFYKNFAGAYNGYILLSIVNLPKSLEGFMQDPISSFIGLAITIGIVVFVWHVRSKLFPDFALITPKKIKGEYVFSS